MKISSLIIFGALIIGAYFMFFAAPNGFSEEDIKNIKTSIKTEFEKQNGITVEEVTILKESAAKASGFVKLKSNIIGSIIKPCSATMAENGKNYIWQCN